MPENEGASVSWNHEFLKFQTVSSSRSKLMSLRDRIGIDVGRRLKLEDAIEWAAEHEVHWIDIQLESGANMLSCNSSNLI